MAQIIEVQGDPLIQFKKGHVKMKSTTARGLIEKHGLELSIEIYEHISQQVAAIKNVVEKEDLDCIGSGMAEQVLNPTSFATNVLSST